MNAQANMLLSSLLLLQVEGKVEQERLDKFWDYLTDLQKQCVKMRKSLGLTDEK